MKRIFAWLQATRTRVDHVSVESHASAEHIIGLPLLESHHKLNLLSPLDSEEFAVYDADIDASGVASCKVLVVLPLARPERPIWDASLLANREFGPVAADPFGAISLDQQVRLFG